MNSLTKVEEHFAFGENWESFRRVLNDKRIEAAEAGLKKLFPNDEMRGARVLDIGCGSGLSSLAALRLGAARVEAVDIDPKSVAATREMLTSNAPQGQWSARVQSVFDLSPQTWQEFDIVYSWGVLHHTGDMWRAVRTAATMVRPGGLLAIALYHKTPWCDFWTWEKRFYSRSSPGTQAMVRMIYKFLLVLRMFRYRVNPVRRIRQHDDRGMSWTHDVHDWLGGYPYESTAAEDVRACLRELGFDIAREFITQPSGMLGSSCDQFVALRRLT